MIIWGYKTRLTKSSESDILEKSCPQCSGDLELHDLKKWFTLYFIPIFPFNTIESCYKCNNCEQTFKQEVKKMVIGSEKERNKIQKEMKRSFAKALVACMTFMAKADGTICKEEKNEIDNIIKGVPEFENELKETVKEIKKSNEEGVFKILRQAKEVLTAKGILMIIGQTTRVLMADGKINKEEEKLMKKFLLICGLPESLFKEIVQKVKKNMGDKK